MTSSQHRTNICRDCRIARGECPECGGPRVKNDAHYYCEECRFYHAEKMRLVRLRKLHRSHKVSGVHFPVDGLPTRRMACGCEYVEIVNAERAERQQVTWCAAASELTRGGW